MKHQRWTPLALSVLVSVLSWWGCSQSPQPEQTPSAEAQESQATTAPAAEAPQQARTRGGAGEAETLTGGLTKDLSSVDVALPMECRGQEPSWHLSLTEEAITLRRLGEPILVFEPATFRPSGGAFLLFTSNKEGHSLSLMLVDEACTDPMDGTNYPYSVKMTVDGKTYGGCARPVR